jgi:antitoxin ParD1/3/4
MNVSLTPELEKFVEKEVRTGLYQTASEVVRAGLRRLKEEQEARLRRGPGSMDELEAKLLQSVESLNNGKGLNGKDEFHLLRKRIKAARARI